MDNGSWLFGASQNAAGGLVVAIILAVVGSLAMGLAKVRESRWATPVLHGLLAGASIYVLLSGVLVQTGAPLVWWISGLVFLNFLLVMYLVLWLLQRIKERNRLLPSTVGVPEIQPLREASYLWISGEGRQFANLILDDEQVMKAPELWSLSIANSLLSSDPRAAEATGIRVELTYYSVQWQRLFGPLQGCWAIEKSGEAYLSIDSITLGPQDTRSLAIAIRMSDNGPFFALGKESLPFFLWRNPAFELENHYLLKIFIKGDAIQRTFYYQIHYIEEGKVKIGPVRPPENT